jgi:hypothetical protein
MMCEACLPFAIAAAVIVVAGLVCLVIPLGEWLDNRFGAPFAAFGVITTFSIAIASIASAVLLYLSWQ